jgi:hypothetical protein
VLTDDEEISVADPILRTTKRLDVECDPVTQVFLPDRSAHDAVLWLLSIVQMAVDLQGWFSSPHLLNLPFLALYGQSEALQKRYAKKEKGKRFSFKADTRLPVFVTLRRYADALKRDKNVPLIEHIRATIEADCGITGVTEEFLEYYLESGNTILLFDGLDELPNPAFKKTIRDRVRNLGSAYPGNTIIVSSRIYGYCGAFQFDAGEFAHHRLASLREEEIEQFVRDWYAARDMKASDRKEYLDSLLSILGNEEHISIRNLARNPLLLTIMVLVHRVDAVLPDERHVLFQKCTETMLNTWHTWKFHEKDRLHQTKVDRQHMQRMQAMAHWMHHEMGSTKSGEQAVVSYDKLHGRLTEHIETERPRNPDYAPEDLAIDFLEFVQDRAGLLVEIGDRQFSFVHLTFQEYLTSSHIWTISERKGIENAWGREVEDHCCDARWREVIRLFVAGCRSDDSQDFLIGSILDSNHADAMNAQLLGGLLLDGIGAAEVYKQAILGRLVSAISQSDDGTQLKDTIKVLRDCRAKTDEGWENFKAATGELIARAPKGKDEDTRVRLRLTALAAGLSIEETWELCDRGSDREAALLRLLAGKRLAGTEEGAIANDLDFLWLSLDAAAVRSRGLNLCAAILQSVSIALRPALRDRRAFDSLFALLSGNTNSGPLPDFIQSNMFFSEEKSRLLYGTRAWDRDRARDRALDRDIDFKSFPEGACAFWKRFSSDPEAVKVILQFICDILSLMPSPLWCEALEQIFLPTVPERIHTVNPNWWAETRDGFKAGNPSEADVYAASWQLMFDGMLYIYGNHNADEKFIRKELKNTDEQVAEHLQAAAESQAGFSELAELTRERDDAPLRIANCIRSLAYGEASQVDDLKAMVESDDEEIHDILVRCYWLPTPEEARQEAKDAAKKK